MEPAVSLSVLFLLHFDRKTSPDPAVPAEGSAELAAQLEAELARLLVRCRAVLPTVALAPSVFVPHLARCLAGQTGRAGHAGLLTALADLHGEDLYLACACAHGLPEALQVFERGPIAQVPRWLAGHCTAAELPALADEVTQRLRQRLLVGTPDHPPRITRYGGRAPLATFVYTTCRRLLTDLVRTEAREPTSPVDPLAIDRLGGALDPDLLWMKHQYREPVEDAFRDAVAALPEDQRKLLRLRGVLGLSIDQLGPHFGRARSTMDRRVRDLYQTLLSETRRLLHERLGLPPSQVSSLTRLLASQIDVSLGTLLGAS